MRKIILACVTAISGLSFAHAQVDEATDVIVADTIAVIADSPAIVSTTLAPVEEPELAADAELDSTLIDTVKTRPRLLGFSAGINMSTYSTDLEDVTASFGFGGQIGLSVDQPIGVNLFKGYLSINPELIFAYKTVNLKEEYSYSIGDATHTYTQESADRMYSMNLPVHVKWNRSLGDGFLTVAAGPMLNMNLGGTNKFTEEVIGEDGTKKNIDRKILLFQADPDSDPEALGVDIREFALYNVLGFSLNFKVGYDFASGLSINAGYQLGLSNMNKKDFYDAWNKVIDAENIQIEATNQAIKAGLDQEVKDGVITEAQRDERYKNQSSELLKNVKRPVTKLGSIFLTIGYVF